MSGDYSMMDDQHNKKGMAGLFSQMRTIAASNGYLSPVDQNKQISKFAKMKKDITDADSEYRDGILVLETLRKKQRKTVEETNWVTKIQLFYVYIWIHYSCCMLASEKHYKTEIWMR